MRQALSTIGAHTRRLLGAALLALVLPSASAHAQESPEEGIASLRRITDALMAIIRVDTASLRPSFAVMLAPRAPVRASASPLLLVHSSPEVVAACRQGTVSGDTLAQAFRRLAEAASDELPVGAWKVMPLVHAGNELASLEYAGRSAVLRVRDTLHTATLLHEITHVQLARLDPDHALPFVNDVFLADSMGRIDEGLAYAAFLSYTSVATGAADPIRRGILEGAFLAAYRDDSTRGPITGRLARVLARTDSLLVAFVPERGWPSLRGHLDGVARDHWAFARHRRPRTWDWRAERAYILASEVLSYQRERACRPEGAPLIAGR